MSAAMRNDASTFDAEVLVVGAGPVGQTLAIDLAKRGVSVVLIERNQTCLQHPKMERCNARTIEFYRRLGLADRIRTASRFQDIPMDVFIATHLCGKKILQLPYPSVAAMQEAGRRCNDGTMPLEPYQLISQYTLEPLLKSVVESLPKAVVRFGCRLIRPGSRLPHIWLDDGQALHDRIGNEFTLVNLRQDHQALSALRQSFAEFGAKLDTVQVGSKRVREIYGYDLVLIRPDLHVVWRGNSVPADHRAIATVATGHV